ncbi:hypothetical protein Rsub_04276 [Raphidocelis subcapitata]|uniref:Malonyl-CoA decarboxylase C-terminal domain-containing protein n=1 Tax=Raphidocelis subcapitata TaxID=307507 RepID=A0A2V0NV76_9CHLO|nr:hypothetical protein Rsub_04276 [Raphidocelis subcapitata]|eukprot:GBF91536.1 hypothetical protein Rsub_04276 [Raphidocelis subcapitata]
MIQCTGSSAAAASGSLSAAAAAAALSTAWRGFAAAAAAAGAGGLQTAGADPAAFADFEPAAFAATYAQAPAPERAALLAALAQPRWGHDAAGIAAAAADWGRASARGAGGGGGGGGGEVLAAERLRAAARPAHVRAVLEPLLQHESGVPLLVQLRSDLLPLLRQRRGAGQPAGAASEGALRLARLERDARHLLSLVFGGALLRLRRLEWEDCGGSEALKERLMRASVHPAEDESDLRRRMTGAGRCYALLHPALPGDEPLVVLQVAFCDAVPASMGSILGGGSRGGGGDGRSGGGDASGGGANGGDGSRRGSSASGSDGSGSSDGTRGSSGSGGGGGGASSSGGSAVACFYSIKSTQPGLSGLDLGRTTILRAARELAGAARAGGAALRLVTLSPLPGFAAWLDARLAAAAAAAAVDGGDGAQELLTAGECELLLGMQAAGGASAGPGNGSTGAATARERHATAALALRRLSAAWARGAPPPGAEALRPLLLRLAARYLLREKGRGGRAALDPVAHFHLSNGATLERINFGADASPDGLASSLGLMVNWCYDGPEAAPARGRAYASTGAIEAGPAVRAALDSGGRL